jgi:hypothetical protein
MKTLVLTLAVLVAVVAVRPAFAYCVCVRSPCPCAGPLSSASICPIPIDQLLLERPCAS